MSVFTYVIADETRSFRSIAQKIQARDDSGVGVDARSIRSDLIHRSAVPLPPPGKATLALLAYAQKIQARDDSGGGVDA